MTSDRSAVTILVPGRLHERAVARVERLDSQIGQLMQDPDANVENELARIKREMKASLNRTRNRKNERDRAGTRAERDRKEEREKRSSEHGNRQPVPKKTAAP